MFKIREARQRGVFDTALLFALRNILFLPFLTDDIEISFGIRAERKQFFIFLTMPGSTFFPMAVIIQMIQGICMFLLCDHAELLGKLIVEKLIRRMFVERKFRLFRRIFFLI